MRIVPDRSAATLLPIIQQHVRSGTIVHSDEWAAYNRVQHLPHRVVNHSLHFVDPATSVHTQHAKSYWNRVKTKFKRMKGVHESMVPSYLDEFMWRERHGSTASVHSSGKSMSGHCSQVPCLGSRVAPSAGPHLRQSVFLCSRPVF